MFEFQHDLIITSAGFDAHRDDPLAQVDISTDCFGQMTEKILRAADEICAGRLISMLEGGYDYNALSESVTLHVKTLLGNS